MTSPAATVHADERLVHPEFTGTATEYFRIWIVNLFFTLTTLGSIPPGRRSASAGISTAARDWTGIASITLPARRRSSTQDHRPRCLRDLRPCRKSSIRSPSMRSGPWVCFALPWLVRRALAFNSRNSAYRGLRFDFQATTKQAARVYIGMLAVVVLTAGLAFPWFMARQKAFVVSQHAFGTSRFECELRRAGSTGSTSAPRCCSSLSQFPASH